MLVDVARDAFEAETDGKFAREVQVEDPQDAVGEEVAPYDVPPLPGPLLGAEE